jgi:hypothetical protein
MPKNYMSGYSYAPIRLDPMYVKVSTCDNLRFYAK